MYLAPAVECTLEFQAVPSAWRPCNRISKAVVPREPRRLALFVPLLVVISFTNG